MTLQEALFKDEIKLYDLFNRLKPIEERVGINLDNYLDSYLIISDILQDKNPKLINSFNIILMDNLFIENPVSLFKAYHGFTSIMWQELLYPREPNKELVPHYLLQATLKESLIHLVKKDEIKSYLKERYDNFIINIHKHLAYDEYTAYLGIKDEKLKQKAIENFGRTKDIEKDINRDEWIELHLLNMRHIYGLRRLKDGKNIKRNNM